MTTACAPAPPRIRMPGIRRGWPFSVFRNPWLPIPQRSSFREKQAPLVDVDPGGDHSPPANPGRGAQRADEDDELLERVLAEYPHGSLHFSELMEKHWKRVHAICQAILLNTHDADDAAQETFIKVHRYLLSFRRESLFSTWLARIARNAALTILTRRRKTRSVLNRVAGDPVLLDPWLPRSGEKSGHGEPLQKLLDRLNRDDRLMLILREVEGMSFQEIAAVLDISEGAARMRALRARTEFRKLSGAGARKARA